MTDEEIKNKIREIQIKERISQKKCAKLFRIAISTLTTILSGKQRITDNRRKLFETAFKMYDQGLLK